MKPIIAISMGDFNGIGPEVVLKYLSQTDLNKSTPLILGSQSVFDVYQNKYQTNLTIRRISKSNDVQPGKINLLEVDSVAETDVQPGQITKKGGQAAMRAVEYGINSCMAGTTHALVTAPISKEAIHKAGYSYPGHTEFLAEKTNTERYMMILASGGLRVGLLTGHIPLKIVSKSISVDLILQKLVILNHSLMNNFGIEQPKIAMLGLNPHAGDGGVLGDEEDKLIKPALIEAKARNIEVDGPFPADGFFGSQKQNQYDAILATYHDQGLIPFKSLSFGKGVNFTAGLPIIRTSPDHGTAYDIAGENRANSDSFQAAYTLAVEMARNKFKEVSQHAT
ncbi:4-hydroxythreonine-4-phosphate dehydrogenase PdxA [Rhodohalobacter halophilus]|uniref:4-hydroxythreonine-4-phosphate dehydrogenase PdxA n=1 Tax=Rhodohalobacter halophilus TaxID=1812810 RepID=UPI00083FB288|nr:4-hydroxythreonine-4-phosphate dehydrogenase PdxA [Rhodohalobacter halophilus]